MYKSPAMAYQIHHTRWLPQHKVVLFLFGLSTLISTSASPNTRNVRQTYDDSNSLLEYSEQRLLTSQQHYSFENNNGGDRNGLDNRKPAFRDCINYTPSVREEQPLNVFVIKVNAIDPDKNDQIEYSFVNSASERPKFRINSRTGDISTSYQFDRDEPAREKEVSSVVYSHNFKTKYISTMSSMFNVPINFA